MRVDQDPVKTTADWVSQGAWLVAAFVFAPMLAAHEFPFHAVVLFIIAIGSVAWIEYLVRANYPHRAVLAAIGVMSLLAVLSATNRKD